MKDKSKEYEEQLLKAIKEKKIFFFDHCFAFVPFSRATAYNHELDKVDTIKQALESNRVTAKNYMLNKWVGGDQPTLQIAAMRLLSTSEEHKLLNKTYVEQTNKEIPSNEQDLTKELAKIAEARGITLEELMQIEGI